MAQLLLQDQVTSSPIIFNPQEWNIAPNELTSLGEMNLGNGFHLGFIESYTDAGKHRRPQQADLLQSPELLAQYLEIFAFHYMFGLDQFIEPDILEKTLIAKQNNHELLFYYLRAQNKEPSPFGSFEGYIKKFRQAGLNRCASDPVPVLLALREANDVNSKAKIESLRWALANFFARVDALFETSAHSGLSPFADLIPPLIEESKFPQRSAAAARIEKVLKGARADMQAFIRGFGGAFAQFEIPVQVLSLQARYLSYEKYRTGYKAPIRSLNSRSVYRAKDFIWELLLSNTYRRTELMKAWQSEYEKSATEGNVLSHLYAMATRYDNRYHLVGVPKVDIVLQTKKSFEVIQPFLNLAIQPSLIVVPKNDVESDRIFAIAQRLEKELRHPNSPNEQRGWLYPDYPKLRRGEAISLAEYQKIEAFAKDRGITNLVLCEVVGVKKEWIDRSEKSGLGIVVLDHHGTHGIRKHSTLEQFMEVFHYRPSLNDLIIGVLDRSGLKGLLDLGLTIPEIREVLTKLGEWRKIEFEMNFYEGQLHTGHDGQRFNGVLRLEVPRVGLKWATRSLEMLYLPQVPHIVIEGERSVKYKGLFDTAHDLEEMIRKEGWTVDTTLGGDREVGFLSVAPKDPSQVSRVADQVQVIVQNYHKLDCRQLATAMH